MGIREQARYFEILRRYERKFEPRELEDYRMLLKRHKDDEDLDKLSMQRLENLHAKYHLARERKNYDAYFNNPSGTDSETQNEVK